MIPYGKQSINAADMAAVMSALESDYLTCGPRVEAFEKNFSSAVGAKHAVAVSNGTAALHLAMIAAGIGPGDRVITSPNTFLASANAAAYVGAIPDFADIDPVSYCLSVEALEKAWKDDVKAVVAVAYAGQSCDMPAIAELARSRGAVVIEDACHGVGGGFHRDGRVWKLGGHPWADMTIFSFHPVKTMTTGEGGMLVTDSEEFAERARLLRNHGMSRDADSFVGLGDDETSPSALVEQGPWYYEMNALGFNYRITDLQCALGVSQLKRLDEFTARRREIVKRYHEGFAGLDYLVLPRLAHEEDCDYVSWHIFTVLIDLNAIGRTRSEVINELRSRQIGAQVLYIPVYLQPWYRRTYGYRPGKCQVAEWYYSRCLSLPLYHDLKDVDQNYVIEEVRKVLNG
jgi:UDP-4-amino-4,6-dideoxy-N-acetyl-beta-L-altrosamine transaminase